jgi:CHAD domain-containing protein
MAKIQRLKWDERLGPAPNARRQLPPLVSAYFSRGRAAAASELSPARLHRFRLATKRLRYTLELFRPCYGPGFETRLAALHHVQQLLGEVTDGSAAIRFLDEAALATSRQGSRAVDFLRRRTALKQSEFRKHWVEVFDAPSRERWWITYLSRHSRPPVRSI